MSGGKRVVRKTASKAKRHRKIREKPEPGIRVVPSAQIEDRVSREVERGVSLSRDLTLASALASGYLVSAVYYHDGLFDDGMLGKFSADQTSADPADRIVKRITSQMPRGYKPDWVRLLRAETSAMYSECGERYFVIPVPYKPIGASRNVHPFAIDLFVEEGTSVRSAVRGIVVLAEDGWEPDRWFSTSSVRGGNAVIVFDPAQSLFFRYAHLESVGVSVGDWVEAGDAIGAVGHTGFNANRPGHGGHLHFEINEFDPRTGRVNAIGHDALEDILESARALLPVISQGATRPAIPGSVESADPQIVRE